MKKIGIALLLAVFTLTYTASAGEKAGAQCDASAKAKACCASEKAAAQVTSKACPKARAATTAQAIQNGAKAGQLLASR